MIWVLVFAGLALLGLVGLVTYAVWLWHKAGDVLSEVEMVGRQAEEILSLIDAITPFEPDRRATEFSSDDEDHVRSRQVDLDFEPDFRRGYAPRYATD